MIKNRLLEDSKFCLYSAGTLENLSPKAFQLCARLGNFENSICSLN